MYLQRNVIPFQRYGNAFAHIVVLVVLVTAALTVKFSVAMESQPCRTYQGVLVRTCSSNADAVPEIW
jgi:hypothetical protein